MVAVAATALVPAAAAQGATRTVTAGPPGKVKGQPKDGDVNAFFRKTVTVHVGDKVKWTINGFHTVTFPKKGAKPPPFISPDPAVEDRGRQRRRRRAVLVQRPDAPRARQARRAPRGRQELQRLEARVLGRPAVPASPSPTR